MALLSTFTGSLPATDTGQHVVQRFVTEADYEAITLVSDPTLATFDTAGAMFDPLYTHTLYYVSE